MTRLQDINSTFKFFSNFFFHSGLSRGIPNCPPPCNTGKAGRGDGERISSILLLVSLRFLIDSKTVTLVQYYHHPPKRERLRSYLPDGPSRPHPFSSITLRGFTNDISSPLDRSPLWSSNKGPSNRRGRHLNDRTDHGSIHPHPPAQPPCSPLAAPL